MDQKKTDADAREASAVRTLAVDLRAQGWEVVSTAVSGEERTPIAVVCRSGGEDEPLRTFVLACRSLLRAAERVRAVNPALTGEEHETVQAARLTCRVVAERALVSGATLGALAHAEMARGVCAREDAWDRADLEAMRPAAREAARRMEAQLAETYPSTARKPFLLSGLLQVVPDPVDRREAERELDLALRPHLEEVNDPAARIRISVAAATVLDRFRAEGRTDPAAGRVKVRATGRGERLELEFVPESEFGTLGRLEAIQKECAAVRFSGETAWDAVVNHNSLDIEEEDRFRAFCWTRGLGKGSKALELDAAFREWEAGGGRG